MNKYTSIVSRFRFAFLAIALTPLLLFCGASYFFIRVSTIEDTETVLRAVSENKRAAIASWLDEIRISAVQIRGVVERHFIVAAPQETRTARNGRRRRSREESEPQVDTRHRLDQAVFARFANRSVFSGIQILDTNGVVVYAPAGQPGADHGNFASDAFYLRGREGEYFSDVMRSPFDGNRCIITSVPLTDESGGLAGVLVLEAGLERLLGTLGSASDFGESGVITLADTQGNVLLRSPISTEHVPVKRSPNEGWIQAGEGHARSGAFQDTDGREVIGAYAPIASEPWVLGVELDMSDVLHNANALLFFSVAFVVVVGLLVVVLARYSALTIARPILRISSSAARVSEGDLRTSVPVVSRDEVGVLAESFNGMIASLGTMTKRIQGMAAEIDDAAKGIHASASDEEQAAKLQSTAVSQTTGVIGELSRSASHVSTSAQSIMKQVESTAARIMYLSQKAQEVTKISSVIEEVAQQIHLLSLNASIEAARAGEHGKGFGVVAAEIRKLSEKSNRQTNEISAIINDIQNAVTSAVLATEQVVNGVRAITSSVQAHDEATANISHSMEEIDRGMHRTIDGTKKTMTEVERLRSVMQGMYRLVQQFKVD